ncbi:family 16 glycosylhydrolase [uncultured Polaribacter sp.]|uniref:family 16 glycosylhydrolase n=1 Tax=uncultured Polaribacter sp. TaxID=174711 RepID=UPI0026214CC8|nr:family 16 glycosylhydrolase [uncultured Polaribacter sp.]
MKVIYSLVCTFLMYSTSLFSQQMPIDFSDNSHSFTVFNENTNVNPPNKFDIFNNEQDNSDKVGRFFIDANNPSDSQGFYIDLSKSINLDTNKIITLDFFKYDGDSHTITVKLEQGGSNPDIEVSATVSGSPSSWSNNIEFNFSNATINATGNYNRLTIFIDKGVANKPPASFHIDDINDGSTVTDPNTLDVIYNNLVWFDEFNGTKIDPNKWHHQTFGPNAGRWFNGELQHYTDSNANSFVTNGNLFIVAKKETKNQNGITLDYTSARLNSKYAFTHGRVDVRAKLPKGNGTWPAIWTLGKNVNETGAYFQTKGFGTTNWPACGEIDIMEHGLHTKNVVSSAIHTPSSSGNTENTSTKALPNVAENFHIYSMNWSPNQITFMIDGVGYYTYNPSSKNTSTWPFDLDQFILLNVAMGGFAGTPDTNFTESAMVIDYVRVYQNNTASTDDFFSAQFLVYPNPASNFISIKSKNFIDKIEIYSCIGQLVLKEEKITKNLNINNLQSGLYLMKIYANNKVATQKILIK